MALLSDVSFQRDQRGQGIADAVGGYCDLTIGALNRGAAERRRRAKTCDHRHHKRCDCGAASCLPSPSSTERGSVGFLLPGIAASIRLTPCSVFSQ